MNLNLLFQILLHFILRKQSPQTSTNIFKNKPTLHTRNEACVSEKRKHLLRHLDSEGKVEMTVSFEFLLIFHGQILKKFCLQSSENIAHTRKQYSQS